MPLPDEIVLIAIKIVFEKVDLLSDSLYLRIVVRLRLQLAKLGQTPRNVNRKLGPEIKRYTHDRHQAKYEQHSEQSKHEESRKHEESSQHPLPDRDEYSSGEKTAWHGPDNDRQQKKIERPRIHHNDNDKESEKEYAEKGPDVARPFEQLLVVHLNLLQYGRLLLCSPV
jgi:hypothetical protein